MLQHYVEDFDFKNPDYSTVFARRVERLNRIRENPECLPKLRGFYRENPAQFIHDWGCTVDPRNVEVGRPAVIPFLLFPKQYDWVTWVVDSWRNRRPGVTPKSRESGVSWLAVALSATLCLHHEDMAIGFGSRKEEYVDKIGAPKSLFWKARKFIELLPPEFRGGFNPRTDAPHMRIMFKHTNSIITGEAGDNIGRGDRAGIYFVDESDFLEHPELAEAALSQTTNCRIDISTANGIGKPFHRKVTTWPAERIFQFHWRDDPRKDQAWYDKQVDELDPVTIAQELDIDFSASVTGVLIPSTWVQAAIDAHIKLGIKPTGVRRGALDVADEGIDQNAFVAQHGILLEYAEAWSGKGDDIYGTTSRAFMLCDEHRLDGFEYDADGLGSGVRGDSRVLNEKRAYNKQLSVLAFRGSAAVTDPEKKMVGDRKNEDFFANAKAQAWWALRLKFQATYRAVVKGMEYDPDAIISISSAIECIGKLTMELSQPTYSLNNAGKVLVDKAPEGSRSPNLADAVMIRNAPRRPPMVIRSDVLRGI